MKQYKVFLEENHVAKPEDIVDGYLGNVFGDGKIALYSRGEAIKKARMFGGRIQPHIPSLSHLKQWMGDDASNADYVVSLVHELMTGKYTIKQLIEDVNRYDVEELMEDHIDDKIKEKLFETLSEDSEHFPAIISALRKALVDNPNELVDHIEFDKGGEGDSVDMDTISLWEVLELTFTVKEFCDFVGIE